MAETRTARFELPQWSAGTDSGSRADFNEGFLQVENLGAIDKQGTLGARPAAGVRGTYYFATNTGQLFRDDGSAWQQVGGGGTDIVAISSAIGTIPLTAKGLVGQTANIFEAKVDSTLMANITADGQVDAARFNAVNATAASAVITGKGAASQSGDYLSLKNSAGTNVFKVNSSGEVTSTLFSTATGKAVTGKSSFSNVANMSLFSGNPILEAFGSATAGTFNDFLYLHHLNFDGTAVTRRVGVLMKIGDEISGDASKSGGMYIESTAASGADPSLILFRADAPVLTFANGVNPVFNGTGADFNGVVSIAAGSNESINFGSATQVRLGKQTNDSMYYRIGGSAGTFYWYSGGQHSDTAGNAGSGGSQIAKLDNLGLLTVNRIALTANNDVAPGQASPTFMIGSASGTNLIMDGDEIEARNNGAVSTLGLNADGGDITLGGSSSNVNIGSSTKFKISGHRLTIQGSAPSSPAVGDIWIEIS